MAVVDILQEQDEMSAHSHTMILWPRKWQEYQEPNFNNWQICRLTEAEQPNVPTQSGIYTLIVQPGIAGHPACSYLMYVGKTRSLRRRFGQYLDERNRETGRPKILRLLNKYSDNIWFCFILIPETDIGIIENSLLAAYIPPCNDQFPAEIHRSRSAF